MAFAPWHMYLSAKVHPENIGITALHGGTRPCMSSKSSEICQENGAGQSRVACRRGHSVNSGKHRIGSLKACFQGSVREDVDGHVPWKCTYEKLKSIKAALLGRKCIHQQATRNH